MSRKFYIGFLIIAVASVAYLFIYRTTAPPAEPAANTAEFGGVSLSVDYATTTAARELGLGGRTDVPADYGMLFVFPTDDTYGFWMNDMLVPIDIFWLDAKGQVISVTPEISPETYPSVFYPPEPVRYVLETAAGFARTNSIVAGTSLLLKKFPTVSE